MMSGDALVSSEKRMTDPIEWFVDYVSKATVPEGRTEYDLRMVILTLARLYGERLDGDAKAELVWRLEDPSRAFATGWVEDMVPEVVGLIDR